MYITINNIIIVTIYRDNICNPRVNMTPGKYIYTDN